MKFLGFKKLFKDLKSCKHMRGDYQIKPKIRFIIDTNKFRCFFLPTILAVPWVYRYPKSCVVEIMWLHFRICIGEFTHKEKSEVSDNGCEQ